MSNVDHPRLTARVLVGATFFSAAFMGVFTDKLPETLSNMLVPPASATEMFVEPSGVGIGVQVPERLLHLRGSNAVFRMDRPTDTAAFLIVRTDSSGNPLKSYVMGVNASSPGVGELVINDLGAEVGGPGTRRMTITDSGEAHFSGTVRAPSFVNTSSARFKEDVETIHDASVLLSGLRGVRFTWADNNDRAVGLIAEEVAKVVPEVVTVDESGPVAVNYAALVAVLVEAVKEQQLQIAEQGEKIEALSASLAQQAAADAVDDSVASIEKRLAQLENELSQVRGAAGIKPASFRLQ
ncbi:MAG: tail fiber domain-containing protein [Azoarcus sp.]|nr:tail fiber domain-containing protein [Azoarcus sp.]